MLVNRYKIKGTNIIYGDAESLGYELTDEERQKFMIQRIREINPEIIVVGRDNAERIKIKFPESYYVAFADKISPYAGSLADKIVNLD